MTDLRDVLDSAAGSSAPPAPDLVVADVARGRRALARQRRVRAGAGLLLTGAAVATGIAVVPDLGPEPAGTRVVGPAAGGSSTGADAVTPNPGVDLVAFDAGAVPKPISPGLIPSGWTVSGNEYALVISAPGVDTSPDDFRGKLVVYLDSGVPNEPLPREVEVAVGDRTGFAIREDDSALQVWVPRSDGTALRAQAPPELDWDEATVGRFLGAVQVSDAAVAGQG